MKFTSISKYFKKEISWAILISVISYIIFFYPLLSKETVIYSGRDTSEFHYPSRAYLYEKLNENKIPVWTERIYGGYPIYASIERGYLNPINILVTKLFGPFDSYKLLHFSFYLIGSVSLYLFFRNLKFNLYSYVAANFVYFFNFFILFHQQHFNMILSFYLLPLVIYLTQKFFNNKLKKYILFISFVFLLVVYFGSFQSLLIIMISQILYIITIKDSFYVKKNYTILLYLLIFIYTLPILYPVYYLYSLSDRISEPNIFTQGSFSPIMLFNLAIPFLYGIGDQYMGVLIHREYLMHETYTYIGVVTLLISLVSFSSLKNNTLKKFISIVVIIFLVLATISYIPFLNKYLPPPFNMFRYWVRFIIVLNFALSILVANFFTHKFQDFDIKKPLITILKIIIFIFFLELINFKNPRSLAMVHLFFRDDFIINKYMVISITIGFVAFLMFIFKKIHIKYLYFLLIFDVVFFGKSITVNMFTNYKTIIPIDHINIQKNTRIFDLTENTKGNDPLYTGYWTLLGYDPIAPIRVKTDMNKIGIDSSRQVYFVDPINQKDLFNNLKSFGIEKTISLSNIKLNDNLIQNDNLTIEINKKEEGHFIYKMESTEDTSVQTYIVNDPDWRLKVNGVNKEIHTGKYINFELSKGYNLVELKYIPLRFIYSLLGSIVLLLLYIPIYKKIRFEN